ncbi:EEF1A lysine methyltransferase 2 [Bulinus truncatus]|nr:EEF1A lysine methyltransferase 2 [Bulinus truncatus]
MNVTNMNDGKCIADFSSSLLGTQEYWNEAYERELKNYQEVGDVGEIWFGKEAQNRITNWLIKSGCSMADHLIDLGCGNGMLLLALRQKGFTNLTGIDYSESAIHLSKSILEKEGFTDITFQVCDLLNSTEVKNLCKDQHFNVCIDKGTYDAISLKDVSNQDNNKVYCHNIRTLLNEDGILVITSCNWTREQLEKQFQNDFILLHEIPAPKFTFGGRTGQTVTTLVMKRKPDPE